MCVCEREREVFSYAGGVIPAMDCHATITTFLPSLLALHSLLTAFAPPSSNSVATAYSRT